MRKLGGNRCIRPLPGCKWDCSAAEEEAQSQGSKKKVGSHHTFAVCLFEDGIMTRGGEETGCVLSVTAGGASALRVKEGMQGGSTARHQPASKRVTARGLHGKGNGKGDAKMWANFLVGDGVSKGQAWEVRMTGLFHWDSTCPLLHGFFFACMGLSIPSVGKADFWELEVLPSCEWWGTLPPPELP